MIVALHGICSIHFVIDKIFAMIELSIMQRNLVCLALPALDFVTADLQVCDSDE